MRDSEPLPPAPEEGSALTVDAAQPAAGTAPERASAAVLLGSDATVLWVSDRYRVVIGGACPVGRPWPATLPEDMTAAAQLLADAAIEDRKVDALLVSARPRPRWLRVTTGAVRADDESPAGALLELADLIDTDQHGTAAPTIIDQLTGLYNRRALLELAELDVPELSQFRAVAFVDVRRFRSINQLWGNVVGDRSLIAVSRWLTSIADPQDLIFRLSGDEFLIVCTADSGVAVELRQSAERTLEISGQPMRVALQAGWAERLPGSTLLDTVGQAQRALSAAKREAWRTVVDWLPQHSIAAAEAATLENAVHQAVAAGQVGVHFQPVVQAVERRVHGFESLVRLGGAAVSLQVEQIIAASNQLGLTPHLAEVVFDLALSEGKALRELYPAALVGVNISRQFLATGLAIDTVVRCANRAGLALSQVVVELTEDVAAGLTEELLVTELRRGAELGLRMVIDDFGRGETSLALLRTVPLSAIKLDRSLIPVDDDTSAWKFVEATAALLRTLTDGLVAEGIESAFQSRRLAELGIELQQGYLFGRPEPSGHWLANPGPFQR